MRWPHLDKNARTPRIAWAALATVIAVLGVTIVGGMLHGPNIGALSGVAAALVAIIVWCLVFLLRKGRA